MNATSSLEPSASLPQALFVINLAATWYMVGLIWMVQCVHYRMFDRVGEEEFVRYAVEHARLITPIVGLPMLLEIFTAAGLVVWSPPGMPRSVLLVGVGLVMVIWISTAAIQVPCHEQLMRGYRDELVSRLVSTNWIRTVAWSVRGGLMSWLLWGVLAVR